MHMFKHKDVRMQNPVINKSIPPSILFNSGSWVGWYLSQLSSSERQGTTRTGLQSDAGLIIYKSF